MLIRANALGTLEPTLAGLRTLAACPDSPERGDPWRWTVALDEKEPARGLLVEADPDFIEEDRARFEGGESGEVVRRSGHQLVIAPIAGETHVGAVDGPWERWLAPGDVFVLEGEEDETVRVTVAPGDAAVDVVRLAPRTGRALRWVP